MTRVVVGWWPWHGWPGPCQLTTRVSLITVPPPANAPLLPLLPLPAEEQRTRVAKVSAILSVPRGQRIIKKGEVAGVMCVLLSWRHGVVG